MAELNKENKPKTYYKGMVYQVNSGDSLVIRGHAPPMARVPQKTIVLAGIVAPKLGRISNEGIETKDEPYAWEAREFVRKHLLNTPVQFCIEYSPPGQIDFGQVYMQGPGGQTLSIADMLVAEGLARVREVNTFRQSESYQKLVTLQDEAKKLNKGIWDTSSHAKHVRALKLPTDPEGLVASKKGIPVQAVVDYIRDGHTVRLTTIPDFYQLQINLTGIKGPSSKPNMVEPYAEEARLFVETKLLQQDVHIYLEHCNSNGSITATIRHMAGNIEEELLKNGYARILEYGIGKYTFDTGALRAAEKIAKEKRLRIWRDYDPKNDQKKNRTQSLAKVIEIIAPDSLNVKMPGNEIKKVHLAGLRFPRRAFAQGGTEAPSAASQQQRQRRPLFDFQHFFQAREFLRKLLIGKKVSLIEEYTMKANEQYPERPCYSIKLANDKDVSEQLVRKGFCEVVRFRADDNNRPANYDDLVAAEEAAKDEKLGLHNEKEPVPLRVIDVTQDGVKARQFLTFLKRGGKMDAVVEFVSSASRVRLYVPKENCLMMMVFAGVNTPKIQRASDGSVKNEQPFAAEAVEFTREALLQRDVSVEVEQIDKAGNFIGWLFVGQSKQPFALDLVKNGLAITHASADQSPYYAALQEAEKTAKDKKLNVWTTYIEPEAQTNGAAKEELVMNESSGDKKDQFEKVKVIVTETETPLKFYAQVVTNGADLNALMKKLRKEFQDNPPATGTVRTARGTQCAAKFTQDNCWYRAVIESFDKKSNKATVKFVDYGNKEQTTLDRLASLSPEFWKMAPAAQEYTLAMVKQATDADYAKDADEEFGALAVNQECILEKCYRQGPIQYCRLTVPGKAKGSDIDIGATMLKYGFILADLKPFFKKNVALQKLADQYKKLEGEAKRNHLGIWRYGDITEDDPRGL